MKGYRDQFHPAPVVEDGFVRQIENPIGSEFQDRVIQNGARVVAGQNLVPAVRPNPVLGELLPAPDQDGRQHLVAARDHIIESGLDDGRIVLTIDQHQEPDGISPSKRER